jgi:hypothetical protein
MRPSYGTAVIAALLVSCFVSGCKQPITVPPTGAPPAALSPAHVFARYDFRYWSGCPIHWLTFEKNGDSFTETVECASTPTPGFPNVITEAQFNEQVYVTDAFLADPSPYAEIPLDSIMYLPAGTTHCYRTPDTVHTLCHDDRKVVTYRYYNGMALGIYDVNNVRALVSYIEE